MPGSVAAVSRGAAAPATFFGQGRGCYEPFSSAGQAAAAELVAAMLDGREASQVGRDVPAGAAGPAFELLAARGAVPGTRVPGPALAGASVLDDVAALLREGSPEMAAQLTRLRRSPAGTLIRTALPGEEAIDLAQALAGRQVVVFPLGPRQQSQAGIMVAQLVIADLTRLLGGRAGVPADGLIWINGCETMDTTALAALAACGRRSGLATMLGSTGGPVTAALAGQVNVVVVRGQPPPGLAGQPAAPAGRTASSLSGTTWPAGDAGVTAESLLDTKDGDVLPAALLDAGRGARADALSLLVREPVPRLVLAGRAAR